MIDQLMALGLTQKEAKVFLALLEYGNQPASVIAKRTNLPRPTVLYLFENLEKRGYIRKSKQGRTQYFYADPKFLEVSKRQELDDQKQELDQLLPLLKEFQNPYSSPPKIQISKGLDNCRKAYRQLLESETEIHEFAAHDDLAKMGEKFMEDFIAERTKRGVTLHAICKETALHKSYDQKNSEQARTLTMFDPAIGTLYSSIAIYENKVLLLNLYHDAFAILIESREVAETLRTVFRLVVPPAGIEPASKP